MQNKEFSSWFSSYQQQALMLNERRLIVLSGDNDWASSLLELLNCNNSDATRQSDSRWLIYGECENIKANVAKQRFRDKLGTESDFVVFQGTDLSIDAFAGLSGTLVAGGILFLLVNDMTQFTESLFLKRFFTLLSTFSEHIVFEQSRFVLPTLNITNTDNKKTRPLLTYNCITPEQLIAVEAVMKVVKGKRNKPLVLTADRGRGKTSALAIACGQLLKAATKENELRLVITAVDIGSLNIFFNQLLVSLPEGELQKGKFNVKHGTVEFIAIDQLIKQPTDASLVLVDEAAAIPIYLLEQLLVNHSRLVFSSTVHGYEGAGRGFTLKFQDTLATKYPKYRSLHLHEPIRWRVNDPLEKLVFEACLLDAELPNISQNMQKNEPSTLLFQQYSAVELADNEELLKQVFSVLVTAHYQTKPSDVKMLLDNKQMQLVCLLSEQELKQEVVAVALLINEGSSSCHTIDAKEVDAVNQSKRRLKNNFVPQSLLTQCGIEHAFNYHYMRVMRIAVHPQVQQQGIGSYFINKIAEYSTSQGADFLASSFGASKALLSFWLKNNFHLARVGFNKDKASGEQSALVLKALTHKAITTLEDINSEFYRSFDYLLADEYKYLPVELVSLILHYCPQEYFASLSVRDKGNIEAFANGYRQYSSCVFSLHLWLKRHCASTTVEDKDLLVLISRIMQKQRITDVCNIYNFNGKKDLEQFLRSKVKMLLSS